MALTFAVFNKFKAIDGVTKVGRKMRKSMKKFGKTTVKWFKRSDRASKGLSKRLKGLLAIGAALIGIGAITAGLVSAVKVGAQFEQTLVNAAAKFGPMAKQGTKSFQALEDAAAKAGKSTEFSAVQAAEGLNFLAMAGFSVEQSIAALPGVIDLATAANVELGRASDIATDTLGAFNLTAKDSIQLQKNLARVSDVMAKATTTANVDMEQLFETFTEAGPVATALGASIETVATAAGVLGNAGIKASRAGTILKNVFTNLAAATPEAQKQLKKLGVQLKDEATGGFRDIFDILEDLNKSMGGLGEIERAAVLKDIFGKRSLAGVNVLLAKGADGLRKYREQLENSTGAAATMAAMMRDTMGNRFKIFQSTLEGFKITIFKVLSNQIGIITEALTKAIKVTDEWLTQNRDEVEAVVLNVTAAFVALVAVVKTIGKWLGIMIGDNKEMIPMVTKIVGLILAWKGAMLLLNGIMAINNAIMKANPIGIIIVGVIAWISVIKTLIRHQQFLKQELLNVVDWMNRMLDNPLISTAAIIFGPFLAIPAMIAKNWGKITETLKPVLEFITNLIGKITEFNASVIGKIAGFFGGGEEEKPPPPEQQPRSPNEGLHNTIREEKETRGRVDVDFHNLPKGTTVDQEGEVPGFNLGMGFSGA